MTEHSAHLRQTGRARSEVETPHDRMVENFVRRVLNREHIPSVTEQALVLEIVHLRAELAQSRARREETDHDG